MRNQIKTKQILLFFITFIVTISLYAAAGGGGGGHSGGGGGGSSGGGGGDGGAIFYLIWWLLKLIFMLPTPFNFIVLGLIIYGIWYATKNYQSMSGLNNIPSSASFSDTKDTPQITQKYTTNNPDFDTVKFKQKVRTSFLEIQDAWMKKDLSKVRKWISDGVYQRFNTQFLMMQQLEQTNEISNINIQNIFIDDIETDGVFDIMHVGIHYSMLDGFASKKYLKLNDSGPINLIEYWSYIKKLGVKEKDLYHSTNCPKCGGNLPDDGGETAKCPYCSTITYLGDYDWVLAEITQADDYLNSNSKFEKQGKFAQKINQQIKNKSDFSLQTLEDKASNGYMQLMTALMFKKPEIARRFVADNLFEKIEQKIKSEPDYLFFRLYLNHVTSFDYFQKDNQDNIVIALKKSQQKINLLNPNKPAYDSVISSQNEIVILSRDINAIKNNGSLYAHSCPNCGAPIKDTLNINCNYCDAVLNSPKYEWIISDWMNITEYENWKKTTNTTVVIDKKIDTLDDLFDVRDYAFNNMMVMMAADGVFADEEIEYANQLAKKWNYNPSKVAGLMQMAKQRQLVIRMPEDATKKQKIISQMEKVANLDGKITLEEQKILEDIKSVQW